MPTHAFAGYPTRYLHAEPDSRSDPVQQLIWGDWVGFLGEESGEWARVRGRNENGWIKKDQLQDERLLEVDFVDVGQGDGALVVTPDNELLLVDAGRFGNMLFYLSWRFDLPSDEPVAFQSAVISHSDQDHYGGFAGLFAEPDFTFGTLYHNGLVERAGARLLGERKKHGKISYLTDLILDDASLRQRLAAAAFIGRKRYPGMLRDAIDAGRVGAFQALTATDGFLPGYEEGQDLRIELLGPVPETISERPALRWFGDDGKTKNGHSVILRLVYRGVKILLGGDLNIPAERYLLNHYTGLDPDREDDHEALVMTARQTFAADVAKACHHGSAEFTDLFLRAVNSLATVISSGDDEPYAHPRPDSLGAIGKHGRGPRPLIFSTELARSTREFVENMQEQRDEIERLQQELRDAVSPADIRRIDGELTRAWHRWGRNVAVYGLINLRTDGRNVLLAYKLERPNGSVEWDVHCLEPDASGTLQYAPDR